MKGDFSRNSFDPYRAYRQVLHQQGRMITDADLNEQAATQRHLLRMIARDVIGSHGGPAGQAGFEIMFAENGDILIGPGRYYVDGVMVENERIVPFAQQPNPLLNIDAMLPLQSETATLLYLDIVEHVVSSVEQPDLIDPALGGAGTSLRLQTIWHVRAIDMSVAMAGLGDDDAAEILARMERSLPLLAIRPKPTAADPGLPSAPGYTGTENKLVRIEIHQGGPPGDATYKWSRENGRILSSWRGFNGDLLLLPEVEFMSETCVLELTDAACEIGGVAGEMVEVAFAGPGLCHIVAGDVASIRRFWEVGPDRPFARRWETIANGAAVGVDLVTSGNTASARWMDLGDGIQIAFSSTDYVAGDYWQLPVRQDAGLLWPGDRNDAGEWQPRFCPSAGIHHFRAPLAYIGTIDGRTTVRDLRRIFEPQGL
ncbi:MAG TPA: DUF6519 domain-containing protein [Croceibacterium sp.]|nr:DUF6519 domain-containing protein [Croceibacterium sp.]